MDVRENRYATGWPISGASTPEARPADIARHVASAVSDLAALARSADLELLAYLLDLAQAEANGGVAGPEHRTSKGR